MDRERRTQLFSRVPSNRSRQRSAFKSVESADSGRSSGNHNTPPPRTPQPSRQRSNTGERALATDTRQEVEARRREPVGSSNTGGVQRAATVGGKRKRGQVEPEATTIKKRLRRTRYESPKTATIVLSPATPLTLIPTIRAAMMKKILRLCQLERAATPLTSNRLLSAALDALKFRQLMQAATLPTLIPKLSATPNALGLRQLRRAAAPKRTHRVSIRPQTPNSNFQTKTHHQLPLTVSLRPFFKWSICLLHRGISLRCRLTRAKIPTVLVPL